MTTDPVIRQLRTNQLQNNNNAAFLLYVAARNAQAQREATEYQRQQLNLLRAHQGLPPIPHPAEIRLRLHVAHRFGRKLARARARIERDHRRRELREQGRGLQAALCPLPQIAYSVVGDPAPDGVVLTGDGLAERLDLPVSPDALNHTVAAIVRRWEAS